MAKYLISFPSAAMVVPEGEWEAVGREAHAVIDEASRYVPLEQLALSPQCGFSSTVHGNAIAMETQAAKLRLIVEVAREVWGES